MKPELREKAETAARQSAPLAGYSAGKATTDPEVILENSIQLHGITKSFKGNLALAPLDLNIQPGGIIGLVGPDGAGKTTLLRILAGLLEPSAGKAVVAGFDPVRQSRELHAILGYMPQRFGLYEDLSVQENLDLYAALHGVEAAAKASSFAVLLEFTGLAPFVGRLAGRLSGGMKQKLGLACTLLAKPRVLLLDEPGVGVDPISRQELWRMVHELADGGMFILWSTSYLDEAERCREVLLLNEGRLIYAGCPEKLTATMQQRSFLLLASDGNNRKLLQKALLQTKVNDGVIQGRFVRLITDKEEKIERVLEKLNLPPQAAKPTPPRLEDAFIGLLGGLKIRKSALAELLPDFSEPGKAPEVIIEAIDLTKKFGAFTASDRINFFVKRGEIFGLLGPNGAGKSTTFKMLCGLLKPSAGQALVAGLDLKRKSVQARQRLGYMAQKFSLYGGLSVIQNLNFFSGAYGLKNKAQSERVEEMIATFNLGCMLGQNAEALPLGYKQRLALACALMHRPDILFLDEPTSGVDPITRREFWMHINSMVEKGVTVLVTTHFMDEAEYCDRIGLVYQGKMIAAGSPDELKQMAADGPPDSESDSEPSMENAFIRLVKRYDQAAKSARPAHEAGVQT